MSNRVIISLFELNKELYRSKNIIKASQNSTEDHIKQCDFILNKHDLQKNEQRLLHLPLVRKNIINSFIEELKEASLKDCCFERYRKKTIESLIKTFGFKEITQNRET